LRRLSGPIDEVLGSEEGSRYRGIDVDDRERSARLQHRIQRSFSSPTAPVSDGCGDAHYRCADKPRNDRRECPFAAREDKIDLGSPSFESVKSREEPVKSRDPYVVLPDDPDPERDEERASLLGKGDIARPGR